MRIVSSIIIEARQMIEKYGWVQGSLCTSAGYCIVGAIVAVEPDEELRDLAFDCIRAECRSVAITKWNDTPGRTRRDAIEVMKKAERRAQNLYTPRPKPALAGPDRSSIYS